MKPNDLCDFMNLKMINIIWKHFLIALWSAMHGDWCRTIGEKKGTHLGFHF